MKKWVTNILNIQKLDMRLRNLEVKYKTIPHEKAKLKEEYLAEKQKVLDAKEQVNQIDLAMKKAEAETAALQDKQQKAKVQSALVKKNTEYQALMADIEDTKQKLSDQETIILELMDKQEAARKQLAVQEKEFAAAERQVKEELAEFEQLVANIKEEVVKIKTDRKQFLKVVDLKVLEAYTNILTRDTGKPVVAIVNGSCEHCALKVTPQTANEARKGTMVFCDNCSHILYDPDAEL